MINLEIEAYEPYHIGNKLNPAMNFDSMKSKLRDCLKEAGYSLTDDTPQPGQQIILNMGNEILGTKDDSRVELNHTAQALNVIGTNPSNVSDVFSEITSILEDIGYEIDKTILFFEIISSITVKSDGKPIELLNNTIKSNLKSFPVSDVQDLNVVGVRIGGESSSEDSSFVLTVEPSVTSPSSRFVVKLQYRTHKKENVSNFHKDLNNNVTDFINRLV